MASSADILRASPVADADVYLVECDLIVDGKRQRYFAEREAAHTNRADTLQDIIGRQFHGLRRVLCMNPFEGWCRDVSEDIARDVLAAEIDNGGKVGLNVVSFIEEHLGCEIVATAEREAA